MNQRKLFIKTLAVLLTFLLVVPQGVMAQSGGGDKPFSQEELDQIVAPIALYPDSLLAQIFMASTYPLEVVQAARWVKTNKTLKADALTAALEKENWDPSVKSLVNFPQVLDMMNEKLDWTQKIGDAFLAQQKDVMDTVQKLRAKAQAEGNLKTTQQQTVVVEKETQTIIIESANPQVVYVPTYNPTVVYGAWAYPAYPPYTYYPPGYTAGAALFAFGAGVAVGAAWGYAWGNCNWGRGDVDVNVNRNANINTNINRGNYQNKITSGQGGQGKWQHNAEHRKGVSYRDQGTAQKYNRAGSGSAQSREAYRGRAEAGQQGAARGGADQSRDRSAGGRQDDARGGADQSRDRSAGGRQDDARGGADQSRDRSAGGRQDAQGSRDSGVSDRSGTKQRGDSGGMDRAGGGEQRRGSGGSDRAAQQPADRGAFSNQDRGSQTKDHSSRGNQSLSSSRGGASSGSRGGSSGFSGGSSGSRSGGSGGSRGGGGGGGRGGRGR